MFYSSSLTNFSLAAGRTQRKRRRGLERITWKDNKPKKRRRKQSFSSICFSYVFIDHHHSNTIEQVIRQRTRKRRRTCTKEEKKKNDNRTRYLHLFPLGWFSSTTMFVVWRYITQNKHYQDLEDALAIEGISLIRCSGKRRSKNECRSASARVIRRFGS